MCTVVFRLFIIRSAYSYSFRHISPIGRASISSFRLMSSSFKIASPSVEVAKAELPNEAHTENPLRKVICADAIEWLNAVEDNGLPEGYSGFTSLPDLSEVQNTFGQDTVAYKKWFTDSAALFMSKLSVGSYVVFLQSDIRYMSETREVCEWIDKSYLCSAAAERTGCTLMWHKLVYTDKGNSKRSTGRPTYSHLLCYAKSAVGAELPRTRNQLRKDHHKESKANATTAAASLEKADEIAEDTSSTDGVSLITPAVEANLEEHEVNDGLADLAIDGPTAEASNVPVRCTYRTSLFAVPDIFYRGEMLWPKGIGLDCCYVGVMFLKSVANAKGIIDPFTGYGTVLAMANALGVTAIGVEISPKRCRKANNLSNVDLELISPYLRKIAMDLVEERAEFSKTGLKKEKKDNDNGESY